jgi:hypothetical protein
LETQETVNSQGNNEQKEQPESILNTQLQIILQSHSNKSSMIVEQNRYENQWNRIEDPDMNLHSYAHLSFDIGTKNIQWRKTASSTNVSGENGYLSEEN